MSNKAMDEIVGAFELSLLRVTGELENVKRAKDAKDWAAVVRGCRRALKKTDCSGIISRAAELKSAEASNEFRREGNKHYQKGNFMEANECYNKALAFAPKNSFEVILAYSNISAVNFTTSAYKVCLLNIKAALELDCPQSLQVKLKKRKVEAEKYIIAEILRDLMIAEDEDMFNYTKFDVPRNKEILCVSADVCVDEDKKAVAAKEIKSGTMVAMERAFVSNQDKRKKYTSCYYCHKMPSFLIPCEGCSKALFCSMECRDKCFEDYHRVECHVAGHLYMDHTDINIELNKLAVKAAIQMSLKLGWEKLRVASLEMGEELFKKSSVSEAFDSNNPTSLLCYDDQTEVPDNIMINKSLFCASVMLLISRVPDYWPKEKKEKQKAMDALSRIILHLNTTFKRRIMIGAAVIQDNDSVRHMGWFSFTSKLAHSCEPNLLVVGFRDHVALVALQRIKKGEQLTICYIDHFYDISLVPSPKNTCIRQQIIESEISYKCECRVCLLEWESNSHVKGTLTNRQKKAYNQCGIAMETKIFSLRMKAIGEALDELTGCINTTEHRKVFGDLMETVAICQCLKFLNQ